MRSPGHSKDAATMQNTVHASHQLPILRAAFHRVTAHDPASKPAGKRPSFIYHHALSCLLKSMSLLDMGGLKSLLNQGRRSHHGSLGFLVPKQPLTLCHYVKVSVGHHGSHRSITSTCASQSVHIKDTMCLDMWDRTGVTGIILGVQH